MGETYCAYVFDGGEMMDQDVWFTKALAYFQAAASGSGDIGMAAKAGQAQTLMLLGRLSEAAQVAAGVPDDFAWWAHYTDQDTSILWEETQNQTQASVWGTSIAALPEMDPRAPWEDQGIFGAGGTVEYYQQEKYEERNDDHALAKGWEMRLIEAQALLTSGQWQDAMDKINHVRSGNGVPEVTAASEAEAWTALKRERLVELVTQLSQRKVEATDEEIEEAARRGAIAALVIHETEAAGYGWNVASSSPGENYAVVSGDESAATVLLQGWLHRDAAAALLLRGMASNVLDDGPDTSGSAAQSDEATRLEDDDEREAQASGAA